MALPYPYQRVKDPLSIPPGLLRNEIQVQQTATTQDALGSPSAQWMTVLTVMASIEDAGTREGYERTSEAYSAQITHLIRFWYPGATVPLAGGFRVVFGARIFTVQTAVNVQQRNRVIVLKCIEVDATL